MHPDLAKLTRAQRLANDVAAYKAMPQTEEEIAWASLPQEVRPRGRHRLGCPLPGNQVARFVLTGRVG
jgi:hypothetical protein